MTISIIAAVAKNKVIGKDNDLIWHLPKDMAFFKETTQNHWVIMGRKNFESIPHKFRPLPNRTNVVVTRQKDYKAEDCIVVNSIQEALDLAQKEQQEEVFIIGGGQIYSQALEENLVNKMYITHIDKPHEGDAFFPEVDYSKWNVISEEFHAKDDKHEVDFVITLYERR